MKTIMKKMMIPMVIIFLCTLFAQNHFSFTFVKEDAITPLWAIIVLGMTFFIVIAELQCSAKEGVYSISPFLVLLVLAFIFVMVGMAVADNQIPDFNKTPYLYLEKMGLIFMVSLVIYPLFFSLNLIKNSITKDKIKAYIFLNIVIYELLCIVSPGFPLLYFASATGLLFGLPTIHAWNFIQKRKREKRLMEKHSVH